MSGWGSQGDELGGEGGKARGMGQEVVEPVAAEEPVISLKEIARRLGVNTKTVWRWCNPGAAEKGRVATAAKIVGNPCPHERRGRKLFMRESAVRAWMTAADIRSGGSGHEAGGQEAGVGQEAGGKGQEGGIEASRDQGIQGEEKNTGGRGDGTPVPPDSRSPIAEARDPKPETRIPIPETRLPPTPDPFEVKLNELHAMINAADVGSEAELALVFVKRIAVDQIALARRVDRAIREGREKEISIPEIDKLASALERVAAQVRETEKHAITQRRARGELVDKKMMSAALLELVSAFSQSLSRVARDAAPLVRRSLGAAGLLAAGGDGEAVERLVHEEIIRAADAERAALAASLRGAGGGGVGGVGGAGTEGRAA